MVLICGRILSTICGIMQRVLYGIQQWCIDRELSVNPSKTEMVLFTRRYKPEKLKTITFKLFLTHVVSDVCIFYYLGKHL